MHAAYFGKCRALATATKCGPSRQIVMIWKVGPINRAYARSEGVPAQMYDKAAARLHLRCAQDILDWAKALV